MGIDAQKAAIALLPLCLAGVAQAGDGTHWKDDQISATEPFQVYHPDQQNRRLALEFYEAADYPKAYRQFLKAAYWADKPSQAAIAEMLWQGVGVESDRAAAYAWMDLAAERGYTSFLSHRERYWAQLNEAERARAIKLGAGVYAGYGDKVAKPRIERQMRLGEKWAYNSVGHKAYARVRVQDENGVFSEIISGFYDPKYWQPRDYWKWQEALWSEPKQGKVLVGPLEVGVDPPQPVD